MTQEETLRVMQALDSVEAQYTVDAKGPSDHRVYYIETSLDGLGAQRLRDLLNAIESVAVNVDTLVDRQWLRVS